MSRSEINATALVCATFAAMLVFGASARPFGWIETIASGALLVILLSYSSGVDRGMWQSVAFAMVCALCVTVAADYPLKKFAPAESAAAPSDWLLWIWGVAAVIFLAADRIRTSASSLKPVRDTHLSPRPSEPTSSESKLPELKPSELKPSEPSRPAVTAEPIALPPGVGKPATIYVHIVGEGLAVLRPVQAEHLGRDFYRVAETPPEGEAWEFQTGQIVRCKKQKLSSGKALVAYEEAPRVS